MRKKIILFPLIGLMVTGTAFGLALANKNKLSFVSGVSTSYNHYEAVAATCTSYGIKEYWTDCRGDTVIEQPEGVTFIEKGQPSAADIQYIIDTYGATDPRIIAPIPHSYVNSVVTDKIGYFGTVCEHCGVAGEASSDIMQLADIDFTLATYGANGGKWGTNVQPTAKTMTYEVVSGGTEEEIFLPKINFSLYTNVSFTLTGNVWDARVGLQTGSYAFPYSASGVHSGTLSFAISATQVVASLECSDGVNQNLTITDSDIINGNKALSLFMIADDPYRAITAELTGLANSSSCTHNFVADTSCIGKEVCSICSEARGIANPTIDFTTNLYSANTVYELWGAYPQDGWVRADNAGSVSFVNYTDGDICIYNLPKIYFAGFSSITIDVAVNYGQVKYSLDHDFSSEYQVPFAGYSLKVVFENISSSSMTVKILDAFETVQVQGTCSSANVLNGLESYQMFVKGSGNVGWDAFSNFTFTA